MTEQEKELLLKDLCARLPYGVMCKIQTCFVFEDGTLRRGSYDKILDLETVTEINEWKETGELEKFKPYLRPMSSMTEDEKKEFIHHASYEIEESVNGRHYEYYLKDGVGTIEEPTCNPEAIDWLNTHHFDYRGLIEKGLALEAPKNMYK
jgi:hypothetical protein